MTFAEKVKKDTLEALQETLKEQYEDFDFANDDEKHCIDELTDLSLKLGAMVGKVLNVIEDVRGTALISYLQNQLSWSALTHIDINRDYAKYADLTEGMFDDDEDDDVDDDFGVTMTEITAEEAKELIEKVLKELREDD